jgi:ketosteroid isomerase-like protein
LKPLILLCVCLIACTLAGTMASAKEDPEKLKELVQSTGDRLIKATLAGDWDTLFASYTDDVVSLPNRGDVVTGREALRQQYEEMEAAGMRFHSISFTAVEAWPCGDFVCEYGTYDLSLTPPGAPGPLADSGKYFTLWQKQRGGSLKVKLEIWNTSLDPAELARQFGQ